MTTTTVTVKGQITIPKNIRNALDLQTGDQIIFVLEGKKAILYPSRKHSLMQLRGAFDIDARFTDHQAIREVVALTRGKELLKEGQDA